MCVCLYPLRHHHNRAFVSTVEDSFWIVGILSMVFVAGVVCKSGTTKEGPLAGAGKTDTAKDPVYSGF